MQKKNKAVFIGLLASVAMLSTSANAEWMFRGRLINKNYNNNDSVTNNIKIDNTSAPEASFDYYFGKEISFEFSVSASKDNTNLGNIWVVPVSFTGLYHFFADQPLQVYAGGGVNYTFFNAPGNSNVDSTSKFGPVFQVGTDLLITKNFLINLDVKKMYISAKVNGTENKLDPWVFGAGFGYRF